MSKQLGTMLLQAGIVTQEQLEDYLEQARRRNLTLWQIVLEEKQISEESLAEAFSRWLKVPYIHLASTTPEPEALQRLSDELARKHVCLPLKVEGKSVVVAMANPSDYTALQDLQFALGRMVKPVVATRTEILDAIEQHFAAEEKIEDFLEHVSEATDFRIMPSEKEDQADLDRLEGREAVHLPPVVKMCNLVIRDAIKAQASDIHIEATLNAVEVRFRVDGVLRHYMQMPKWLHNAVLSRLKVLAKLDIAERRLPQDGRIKVQIQNRSLDIRLSTLPTHFGEKAVMRILGSSSVPLLKTLGYTDGQLNAIDDALAQPQGLILVTGPTGSGKSTTLYSMLERRKSPEVNIVTVEDPIEYQLPGINQVQVNYKKGLTFANSLRSILRQDPDVILVGEIRDRETAEIAFHASMTGHLVLSTLHTNSALGTVSRLLDLGLDPPIVAESLAIVLAQRLARRVCMQCREEYTPSSKLLDKLHMEDTGGRFYRGHGCAACAQTGYAGRTAVCELLRITPSVRELIHRRAAEHELRKAAIATGLKLLLEDAMDKVRQGLTTLEEILRVVQIQEEEVIRCPQCNSYISSDFSTCPYCLHELKHLCAACGQELKLEWKVCPYCNVPTVAELSLPAASVGPGAKAAQAAVAAHPKLAAPAPAAAPAATPAAEPVAMLPPSPAPLAKKPRVLIVDDDDGIKIVVSKALSQLPMPVDVDTASDGIEALKKMENEPADLLVLDVMMPGLDGFGVCDQLRKGLRTAFVPILMLTANADESSRTKGYLVGTDDYMNKPFSVPELNARVMRLLRRTYGI